MNPTSGLHKPELGITLAAMQSMYEYVLGRLQSSKGRWGEVATGSGVSKRTIEKIARREIEDPGVSHIEKLAAYFSADDKPN